MRHVVDWGDGMSTVLHLLSRCPPRLAVDGRRWTAALCHSAATADISLPHGHTGVHLTGLYDVPQNINNIAVHRYIYVYF